MNINITNAIEEAENQLERADSWSSTEQTSEMLSCLASILCALKAVHSELNYLNRREGE